MARLSMIGNHIESLLSLCKKTQKIATLSRATGVSVHTLYRWRDRGKLEVSGLYRAFYDALTSPVGGSSGDGKLVEPTTAKITLERIDAILEKVKIGMSWDAIAHAVGVSAATLYRWMQREGTEQAGLYREFYDRLAELKMSTELSLIDSVMNNAVERQETFTNKTVTKTKEGRVEFTSTSKPPNAEMALKMMERINPVFWAPIVPHRVDVDWEKTVREQGGDPREIEEFVRSELEKEGLI